MNITFENKVAIVTGAAGGIGSACTELLASSGARVACVDMRKEQLDKVVNDMQKHGVVRGFQLDVTDAPAIASTVSNIRHDMGEVDILICCAGVAGAMLSEDATEEDWDRMHAVNARGLFFCNQAVAVQSMIPRKTGTIVNIASVTGVIGMPLPFSSVAYSATKGGVVQITKQEAVEWARYNIRVNAVAPTFVLTEMTRSFLGDPKSQASALEIIPLGRFAVPEDIAATVCFLSSDAANMVTGVILPVDGGQTTP